MGASIGDVGIMLTKKAYFSISRVESFSSRILIAHFNGNPVTTIVVTYRPTEAATSEAAEEYHNDLRNALEIIPAHNLLLIVGDLNAKMSRDRDAKGWYYHQTTNRNGNLLKETMLGANLEATNHRFCKKPGKLWTFLADTTGIKSQIDYKAYNTYSSVGSDHRLVAATVKLSLRSNKKQPNRTQYNWDKLRWDRDLQEQYTVAV